MSKKQSLDIYSIILALICLHPHLSLVLSVNLNLPISVYISISVTLTYIFLITSGNWHLVIMCLDHLYLLFCEVSVYVLTYSICFLSFLIHRNYTCLDNVTMLHNCKKECSQIKKIPFT